ncbi:MAG: hypothetical protein EKK42_26485 [Pseudonocardiaceae bacterium]|nr:MAG: hypothetical protein EKK42_26485 [Pseudonocardiaceae bacterium]
MYEVTTDEQSQSQIEHLPAAALVAFAEARAALEVAPWTAGMPYHPHRPDGPMRALTFGDRGQGDIVFLVVEELRRVDLLMVMWLE